MIDWIKFPAKAKKHAKLRTKTYNNPTYNQGDVFRHWRDLERSKKVDKGITPKIAKVVWEVYNEVLSDMLLEGIAVDLPYGLGSLGIYLRKIKKQAERFYLNHNYYRDTGEGVEILRKTKILQWSWRKGRTFGPLLYANSLYSFKCTKDLKRKTNMQDIFAFGNYYSAAKTTLKCRS